VGSVNPRRPFGTSLNSESSHRFAKLGDKFFDAAKLLDAHYQNQKASPAWPFYDAAYRAIELYLKSYLLRHGATVDDLRDGTCRKLTTALTQAKQIGLVLNVRPDAEAQIMKCGEPFAGSDFQRRSVVGCELAFPDALLEFIESVRAAVN